MSHLRRLWHQHVRLASSLFVLAGAVTIVAACSSGESVGRGEVAHEAGADAERVALAQQGLGWDGGCVCLPIASCPPKTGGCVRSPSALECPKLLCLGTSSVCFVESDKSTCTNSAGKTDTCDGGSCGTCTGCYSSNGLCQPGTATTACLVEGERYCKSCDDGNECTTDSCGPRGCTSTKVEDKTACTGGMCFGGTCCTGCTVNGTCQPGVKIDACGAAGAECRACAKPSNPCLRATCIGGACGTEPVPKGTSCTDGKVCNGEETCDGNGACLAGTPKDCTTSDACMTAHCDDTQGCVSSPNVGAKCSDGNACTVGDVCDANGQCVPSGPKNCDDGKFCTKDACDPATGTCSYEPLTDGTDCDDLIACTTGETCQAGVCKAAGTISCDDNNICTQDILDCAANQCSYVPVAETVACVPEDKCFYNGTCNAGQCQGTTAVNCDDGNPCTQDSCDPAVGCVHTNEPLTTACVDGNPCTTDDRCRVLGKCQGTPIVCAALDDCHLPGLCDEKTGVCGSDPRRNDGEPCANGTGSCVSGSCEITATGGAAGSPGVAGAPGIGGAAGTTGILGSAGTPGTESTVAGAAGLLGTAGTAIGEGGASGAPAEVGGDAPDGGMTSGGKSGRGGGADANEEDIYKRDPGGCSCSMPDRNGHGPLASLLGVALAFGIRRRRRNAIQR